MFKIAVLVSGSGSNLQSLMDACDSGRLKAEINMVIADRKAYGLERASNAGIPTKLFDRKKLKGTLSAKIAQAIPAETDLIVLAGYLSILGPELIEGWQGKIINIHPALLPAYGGKGMYGMNVHRAVIAAGEPKSGCSVHYVDAGVDTGDIIMQREVPVLADDSPEVLQKRILEQEHRLLPEAVGLIIQNR